MLNTLRSRLGSDFTAFHTALNAAKPSKAARKAIYEAIKDMPNVADAKAFANAFAADSKFAKGIADDLDLIRIWKVNIGETDIDLLKSYRSVPDVIATHLNVRVASTSREVIGAHNATVWDNNSIVKKVSLETNPTYTVPSNLPLSDASVPHVIVLSDVPHPTVSGVRVITYRVPAISNSGKTAGLTTGFLRSEEFTKTIFDPTIWPDLALENACKSALKNGNYNTTSSSSIRFNGTTNAGAQIEGFLNNVTNRKITTFYFK